MAFWRPGTVAPGSSLDRDSSAAALSVTSRVQPNLALDQRIAQLPIAKHRDALLHLLEQHPVVILQSPTGTGKSTQLPQYLLGAGWAEHHAIAVTQPRRVAAIALAQRVAQEVGSVLGDEVGYSIRFEALCTEQTKILYLTDGMLFREILLDPLLSRYSVVMVDEAHERSLYTDLLLGALKKIRRVRPSLRIIISSATIDAASFLSFFNTQPPSSSSASSVVTAADEGMLPPPAKKSRWDKTDSTGNKNDAVIVQLDARVYPVQVAYLDEPSADVVKSAVETIFDIHLMQPAGDILVFLTGREEIDRCMQEIADNMNRLPNGSPDLLPLALHSGLSTEQQMAVFDPPPSRTRKVIISTNVAEASITIEGIKYVVDSGLVKLRSFNPLTSMDALVTTPCSLASLAQRAGRAGRTSPGKCFRLFPASVLATLLPTTPPELTRSDLTLLILQLKSLGIQNILRFDWLTAPSAKMMERGLEFLYCLGAVDEAGKLTVPLGVRMSEMPMDPMMAKILLDSANYECSDEILTIAAMTSVQNVFIMDGNDTIRGELERRKFTAEEGDHLTYLNVYNAFLIHGRKSAKWCQTHRLNFKALSRALSIRTQLKKYLTRFEIPLISCGGETDKIRRCLVSGYFRNAARCEPDGSYRSVREGTVLHAHPSSVLFTRVPASGYVIYHEVIETTKRFMQIVTAVDQEWLPELAPHYYSFHDPKRRQG